MDFKETCIWMSYRYAIGRSTIAAAMHAKDIAKHLDWIPEDRHEFTGEDIISEINSQLNCIRTLRLTNKFAGDAKRIDAFSLLFRYLENDQWLLKDDTYRTYAFNIDFGTHRVDAIELIEGLQNDILLKYVDYKDWIKLAKILLNDTVKLTMEMDGQLVEIDAYEWWDYTYENNNPKLIRKYSDSPNSLMSGWYISSDAIKNVKR